MSMTSFDLYKDEKNTLYRLRLAIQNQPAIDKPTLRELFRKLVPEETDNNTFRFRTVEAFVMNWWNYIGQYEWPQRSCSRATAEKRADEIIAKVFDHDLCTYEYYDDMIFSKSSPPADVACEYFAEICPTRGRDSLWPDIYKCSAYGVPPIDVSNARVAYAYKEIEEM